jgi:hypothetical protein
MQNMSKGWKQYRRADINSLGPSRYCRGKDERLWKVPIGEKVMFR